MVGCELSNSWQYCEEVAKVFILGWHSPQVRVSRPNRTWLIVPKVKR